METDVNLPFITADASGPKHLNIKLTRSKLEAWWMIWSRRPPTPARWPSRTAGYSPRDIDEVILVGGMTRMPRVQQR
jgi:molecular chaperone DnaK